MPKKIYYSKEEIRVFRKKDLRSLLQTLINADGSRNQGTKEPLNKEQIKADLLWVLDLEDEFIDLEFRKDEKRVKKETKEKTEKEPFITQKVR